MELRLNGACWGARRLTVCPRSPLEAVWSSVSVSLASWLHLCVTETRTSSVEVIGREQQMNLEVDQIYLTGSESRDSMFRHHPPRPSHFSSVLTITTNPILYPLSPSTQYSKEPQASNKSTKVFGTCLARTRGRLSSCYSIKRVHASGAITERRSNLFPTTANLDTLTSSHGSTTWDDGLDRGTSRLCSKRLSSCSECGLVNWS